MTKPQNFLLNTEYPLDKVVYMTQGEWTPTGFDSETGSASKIFAIETGIDAPHMVIGEWSDDNWETSYPLGTYRYRGGWYQRDSNSLLYEKSTRVLALGYMGDTIAEQPDNNGFIVQVASSYSTKVKWRAYVMIPESYWETIVSPTASLSNPLVLDTRDNYPKLFEDKIVKLSANTPVTVYHNLGFKPYIRAWSAFGGNSLKDTVFSCESFNITALDESKIVFEDTSNSFVYYRIYADEI